MADKKDSKLIISITSKSLDSNFAKLEDEIRTANKSFLIIGKNCLLEQKKMQFQQCGLTE